MKQTGTVYLIGAGPGDPGLMTLKGRDILSRADVIVYDYLVNPKLLELAGKNAHVVYVGKQAGVKEMPQTEINALLVKNARKGRTVARLKGGDPFVFGRGGEEALALSKKGIPFEVIPGVSSASAVPAYAGIPLTQRDITSSFAVVTGHEDPSKGASSTPWESLSGIGTVVFLMGVKNLSRNMRKLIDAGKPADTPAAVISWGTYPRQASVTGTVGNIAEIVRKDKNITSPAIVVTGDVVKLREITAWFEKKPLFGISVVVTRASEQAPQFVKLLEEKAARVIEFPVIEIASPRSYKALDKAIWTLPAYDWIVFTSVNGVTRFFERLAFHDCDLRELYGIRIAAIGEVTAREIEKKGIKVDILPDDFRAEGLIERFSNEDIKGKRILIPRAREARDILPLTLGEMGAQVDVVTAYETRMPGKRKTDRIKKMLHAGEIDVVTFTSSSTARNFFSAVGALTPVSGKPVFACIGPVTEKTLRESGYEAEIVPAEYTIEKLTDEIAIYFTGKK